MWTKNKEKQESQNLMDHNDGESVTSAKMLLINHEKI